MSKLSSLQIRIKKYTEPKGFFRNTAGSLKVGEIELFNSTNEGRFEDVFNEKCEVYYMELGGINGFDFIYRGEAPRVSIGDKNYNISVEDRIEFLYETLSSNVNYNCLEIICKGMNYMKYSKALFEIEFDGYGYEYYDEDIDDYYDDATLFVIKEISYATNFVINEI